MIAMISTLIEKVLLINLNRVISAMPLLNSRIMVSYLVAI